MSIQYLVDFENVHESGLYGIHSLTQEDSVYIFHTSLTDRIALSFMDDINAWFKVILVSPGKQSLDMHLVSFLGYLIGKESSPDAQYAIVSHDSDYKCISDFWNHSFHMSDKVTCIRSISSYVISTGTADSPNLNAPSETQTVIRSFIIRVFKKHAVIGRNGQPSMLMSELCRWLNGLPEYTNSLKMMGKKPMQYLSEEFAEILCVTKSWNQDWVHLLEEQASSIPTEDPAKSPSVSLVESPQEESAQDLCEISLDEELLQPEDPEDESIPVSFTGESGNLFEGNTQDCAWNNPLDPASSQPGLALLMDPASSQPGLALLMDPASSQPGLALLMDPVPIEEMKLSVRTSRSLQRAGHKVSEDFIHLSDEELLKTRNLGQKGVDEIHRWVEAHRALGVAASEGRESTSAGGIQEIADSEKALSDPDLFFAFAAEFLQSTKNEVEGDAAGEALRASVLRDALLTRPEFRIALKHSGMKPINFMQHIFEGKIDIHRSGGVYRVRIPERTENFPSLQNSDRDKDKSDHQELSQAERKQHFYDQAFSNILQQLIQAGVAREAADEIATIFMNGNSAVEPRKANHTLLCQRFGPKLGAQYLRTTSEMLEAFSFLDEETAKEIVINASRAIADLVDDQIDLFPAELSQCESVLPVIKGARIRIKSLTTNRAHQLYGERLPDPVSSRLDKEFSFISSQNAWSILEIARLAVERSKQYGYPVGSRGSVGSSLVAFLMGISHENPLPPHYNCPECHFTLFSTPPNSDIGIDLPDKVCPHCGVKMHGDGYNIPVETFLGLDGKRQMEIALNISSEIQQNVHEYIRDYFGANRVIRPGTISGLTDDQAKKYASQYAIDHHLNVDANEFEHASDQIISAVRNTGQHPGSLFIIPESYDINDFTPVQYPADSSSAFPTSHYDFYSMNERLLKMDFLGHDTPTLLMLMEQKSGVSPDEIPLNDSGVLSLFRSPDVLGINERDVLSSTGTVGVPEFGSHFLQDMLKTINPTTVEDLIRVSGLSHGTDVWVGNVKKLIQCQVATVYDCPATRDDITNFLTRHGVAFDNAFTISEFIRKGKGSINGLLPEMKEIVKQAGIPDWYIHSCEQIKYLFPRAHTVAYTTDSLRLAWYKLYHPEAFYFAWFRVYGENLDPADLTMDTTHLRRAILSIRIDLQDSSYDLFSEERFRNADRETTLLLLLEMKLRGYCLPDSFFQT